jgi:uncharacterized membrane protein
MYIVLILIYFVLSLIIAYIGKDRKFGFWGFLFCSLFLTPIVGLVAYLASCKKITIILDDEIK